MNKYDSCQDELIMFSYLSGTVFVALACLYTGDLAEGGRFVYDQVFVTEFGFVHQIRAPILFCQLSLVIDLVVVFDSFCDIC